MPVLVMLVLVTVVAQCWSAPQVGKRVFLSFKLKQKLYIAFFHHFAVEKLDPSGHLVPERST